MENDVEILGHVSFDRQRDREDYDAVDVQKDFGTLESWGTIWPFYRVRVVTREDGGKAIRVKYPEGKLRSRDSGACWYWKNFGKHKDLYLSFWVKFPADFDFRAGGKLHGLCGGDCNTGGDKPNGHDGWSSRIHWGKDGLLKQYVYHKDQPGKYGQSFHWNPKPKTIVIGPDQPPFRQGNRKVYLERGEWHFLVTRVVVNDIGERNGFVQSWFDGKLVLDVHGFEFRDRSCSDNKLLINRMYFCTFFGGRSRSYKPVKVEYAYFTDFRVSKGLYLPPELKRNDDTRTRIMMKKPVPKLFDSEVPGKTEKYGYGMRLEWIDPPGLKPHYYEIQYTTDRKLVPANWINYHSRRLAKHGTWINHHGNVQFGDYIHCLASGQTYYYRIRALDASEKPITKWSNVVSGTTDAYDRLKIVKVESRLFDDNIHPDRSDKYGYGMRIEWSPSVDPETEYYEIQYTTDEKLRKDSWKILTNRRSKEHEGWINHHGAERFGDYIKCLPNAQKYYYRVRAINNNEEFSSWSKVVSGTVTDYLREGSREIPLLPL